MPKCSNLLLTVPNLYYEVRPKIDPTKDIIKFIKNNEGKSGIIYCLSRKKVEELTEVLMCERHQSSRLSRGDGCLQPGV